jgi:hypothetical protein
MTRCMQPAPLSRRHPAGRRRCTLRATEALRRCAHNDDQKTGVEIVRKALSSSARQMRSTPGERLRIVGRSGKDQYASADAQAASVGTCEGASSTRPRWCAPLQDAASVAACSSPPGRYRRGRAGPAMRRAAGDGLLRPPEYYLRPGAPGRALMGTQLFAAAELARAIRPAMSGQLEFSTAERNGRRSCRSEAAPSIHRLVG